MYIGLRAVPSVPFAPVVAAIKHQLPPLQTYHGEREVFISDHSDTIHSATILSKCTVWALDDYRVCDTPA